MLHKNLTGENLHISKTSTGNYSPIGIQTPTTIGEIYTNTSTGSIWVATGLTSSNWKQASGSSTLVFHAPLDQAGSDVTIPKADSTHDGYLDASDWNKFNSGVSFTPGDLTSSNTRYNSTMQFYGDGI